MARPRSASVSHAAPPGLREKWLTTRPAMLTAREASDAICEALGAEGIGCVGTKFIVWRKSEKLEQEKKTAAKPAAAKSAKKRNGNYNPVKVSNTRRKEQLRERKQKQKEYFHEAAVKAAIERRKQQQENS